MILQLLHVITSNFSQFNKISFLCHTVMVSVVAKNLRDRRIHKALSDIFDKADTDRTGKLSVPEYLELCKSYNIDVSEEDLESIEALAENNGGGVSKNDFIIFVRKSNMSSQFDTVDTVSTTWTKLLCNVNISSGE